MFSDKYCPQKPYIPSRPVSDKASTYRMSLASEKRIKYDNPNIATIPKNSITKTFLNKLFCLDNPILTNIKTVKIIPKKKGDLC